ncbi:chorismate synthase [soil metagenome]
MHCDERGGGLVVARRQRLGSRWDASAGCRWHNGKMPVAPWGFSLPFGGMSPILLNMSSNLGVLFRISTFGESHGGAVGVVVDGCPPRIPISVEEIQLELDRRKPGQSKITTARAEPDRCEIVSGVFDGLTLGTPICIMVRNQDARGSDYEPFKDVYRPSHADYTYDAKYGIRNWRGGGRASARETIGRVAAGALAKKILKVQAGVEVIAWVSRVAHMEAKGIDPLSVSMDDVEQNILRCPDAANAPAMIDFISKIKADGDSVGGTVDCVIRNAPVGLGEPVFDKLEADLAKAMLSLPASKSFEVGSGIEGTYLKGSEHNDSFYNKDGSIATRTNRSGGIQGGISNGEAITMRIGFKPVATILQKQQTVNDRGEEVELMPRGRHDPCVLPRAVPMVEAMAALVLCDHLLRQRAVAGAPSADRTESPLRS